MTAQQSFEQAMKDVNERSIREALILIRANQLLGTVDDTELARLTEHDESAKLC
jgi:hypothetical protein